MLSQSLLTALALLGTATACPTAAPANISCPIIFDGRVSATAKLTDFDTSAGGAPFGPDYVKGAGLKWSDILLFPNVSGSRFDTAAHKPVEVIINDKSIFNNQKGFRRAGLQFKGDSNNGSPGYNSGIKTLHFSVKQDPQRALNLSHEYLNIWHEAADYSANQFNFQIGTIIGQTGLPKNNFKVLDRQNKQLWSTPVDNEAWQNFAISLDFSKNTITIYYSKGNAPLAVALKATSANLAGAGQYQMGILKKPTGTNDVVNSGYQTAGINEGQIYGGIFVEDSANGCVTL